MKTIQILTLLTLGLLQISLSLADSRYVVTSVEGKLQHRECHYTLHGCHCNHLGKYSEAPNYYCKNYKNVD